MPRFFVTEYELLPGRTAYITGDDARHLKKSLRIKKNDMVVLCDGRGNDFTARVLNLENDAVLVEVVSQMENNNEPKLQVNIFMAITKGEGFEYAIQKCVEAGAASIQPIITEHTVIDIPENKIDRKVERWNKISESAAKQSGRSRIPAVFFPVQFSEALKKPKGAEPSIICYVKEGTLKLKQFLGRHPDAEVLNVFIGPEGGFSPVEWEIARLAGLYSVSLGKRILKAETAGFFVTVAAMYEYGELGQKD